MKKVSKPKCILCERSVGMIFERNADGAYVKRCGDKEEPCSLNYILQPPETADEETLVRQARDSQSIIVSQMKRIRDRVLGKDGYNKNDEEEFGKLRDI